VLCSQAYGVAVSGSYAYVAALGSDSLTVVLLDLIVGSGSIVGNITSASVLDYVRATRPCALRALTSDAAPRSHAPRACSPTCTAPHALSRSLTRLLSLAVHTGC
jgi:hypothetical protein